MVTPKDLARSLSCSTRTVRRYVAILRRLEGTPCGIKYHALPPEWVEGIRSARDGGLVPSDPETVEALARYPRSVREAA